MTLTDLENKIIADAQKVRDLARHGALVLRKSKLVEELEAIEKELAQLVKVDPTPKADPEPKPVAKKPVVKKPVPPKASEAKADEKTD